MKLSRYTTYITYIIAVLLSSTSLCASNSGPKELEPAQTLSLMDIEEENARAALVTLDETAVAFSKTAWFQKLCYFIENYGGTSPTAQDYRHLANKVSQFTSVYDFRASMELLAWAECVQGLMTENGKTMSMVELMLKTGEDLKGLLQEELDTYTVKIWENAYKKLGESLQEIFPQGVRLLNSHPVTIDALYSRMQSIGVPTALIQISDDLAQNFSTRTSENDLLDEEFFSNPVLVKGTLSNIGWSYLVVNAASENNVDLNMPSLMRQNLYDLQSLLRSQLSIRLIAILEEIKNSSQDSFNDLLNSKLVGISIAPGTAGTLDVDINTNELDEALAGEVIENNNNELKTAEAAPQREGRKELLTALKSLGKKKK